jgi:hypothetical protein
MLYSIPVIPNRTIMGNRGSGKSVCATGPVW